MIHSTALIGEPPEHRDYLGEPGIRPTIDPTARIEALVTVDAGVKRPTYVGARTLLMKKVHVGHDARIGADCEIAPLCSIGGHAEIGERVKMGQGALVKPFVKIGDDVRVGMGAVVIRNVPAGVTIVGNPAKILIASAIRYVPAEPAGIEAFDPENLERELA